MLLLHRLSLFLRFLLGIYRLLFVGLQGGQFLVASGQALLDVYVDVYVHLGACSVLLIAIRKTTVVVLVHVPLYTRPLLLELELFVVLVLILQVQVAFVRLVPIVVGHLVRVAGLILVGLRDLVELVHVLLQRRVVRQVPVGLHWCHQA